MRKWSSPTVLVKKKDGTTRFCIDYRRLNQATKVDAYPLPHIEDSLNTLSDARFFCSLDLASGYWQVEMDAADREKKAFVTQGGLYEFRVMPFGLVNAPATFERLMERVLRGIAWSECLVYLDDILVFGPDFGTTLARLERVLDRLGEAGLKLNAKKCQLFQEEIPFLGHIVSAAGIGADPAKCQQVRDWPVSQASATISCVIALSADDDEATARSLKGRMASATLRRPISCSSVAAASRPSLVLGDSSVFPAITMSRPGVWGNDVTGDATGPTSVIRSPDTTGPNPCWSGDSSGCSWSGALGQRLECRLDAPDTKTGGGIWTARMHNSTVRRVLDGMVSAWATGHREPEGMNEILRDIPPRRGVLPVPGPARGSPRADGTFPETGD